MTNMQEHEHNYVPRIEEECEVCGMLKPIIRGQEPTKREIKFRAWDKSEKGRMLYPSTKFMSDKILTREDGQRTGLPEWMTWRGQVYYEGELQDFVLMQYTGLKDKNGKEIYEGDIVKVIYDEPEIYQVKWFGEEGYPAFDIDGWPGDENGLSAVEQGDDIEIEVIGNIYEHPNLL